MIVEILTEGASDVPVIREIFSRHFKLIEHEDFRIHPHKGRGNLPDNIHLQVDIKRRGLLDQLPAKLRGFGKYMDRNFLVVVLIDADNDDPALLQKNLFSMLAQLRCCPPRVLFKIAVEETESWFLADHEAVLKAIPSANSDLLLMIAPDSVVGAWEKLALCIGKDISTVTGNDKTYWSEIIAPHLNLTNPYSPSLSKLISGIGRELSL